MTVRYAAAQGVIDARNRDGATMSAAAGWIAPLEPGNG
jgi:hypothetical protein